MFLVRRSMLVVLLALLLVGSQAFATTVAVVHRRGIAGSTGILDTLKDVKGITVKPIEEVKPEYLAGVDILIVSSRYRLSNAPHVREFVKNGGGVLMTHDAAGSDRDTGDFSGVTTFPELVKTTGRNEGMAVRNNRISVVKAHPITKGLVLAGKAKKALGKPAFFNHSYYDHVTLLPVDDRFVLLEDAQVTDEFAKKRFGGTQLRWDRHLGGNAVLVAAPFGKGRVVLSGILFGLNTKDHNAKVTGAEYRLLMNSINWLSKRSGLGVPRKVSQEATSKYVRGKAAVYPKYAGGAIEVVTKLARRESSDQKANGYEIQFTLPGSAPLGKAIPVAMSAGDLPGGGYRVVLLDENGKAIEEFAGQVESVPGKKRLVFVGAFSRRSNRCLLAADSKSNISVVVTDDGRFAEVHGPHFQMLLAVEGNTPTIQALNLHNQGWFRSWKGLERNDISSPVLRLSNSLWPFAKSTPAVDHEKGLAMPSTSGKLATTSRFPARAELKVGSGKIEIFNTGQMRLEGFAGVGRIATIAFDGYLKDKKWVEEVVSYDLPDVKGDWVWAVREDNYAVGGEMEVSSKMGETGLAPGMERQIQFVGKALVATTANDRLDRLQVQPETVEVYGTFKPISSEVATLQNSKIDVPRRVVKIHKLRKMRGKEGFYDILPQPVELYVNEWSKDLKITKWRISDPSIAVMSYGIKGKFGAELKDGTVDYINVEDSQLDPTKEDFDVMRRFFLRPVSSEALFLSKDIAIVGSDASGKAKLRIPVRFEVGSTLPVGIYTYSNHWMYRPDRVKSKYWPRMMRDIAFNNMDFVIHNLPKYYDTSELMNQRLKRYGLWWIPDLQHLWHYPPLVRDDFFISDVDELQRRYKKVADKHKSDRNILAWHLSEEVFQGKPGEKKYESYNLVKTLYDNWKKVGDADRPIINLVSTYFSPYEHVMKGASTDIFVWDPYHSLAWRARDAAQKVDKGWRKAKDKPAWITLRSCGPNFCDTMDLWLDIRRRSLAAYQANVDGLNYFMYAHWLDNMEKFTYYAVIPGPKGPVATPRWQAIGEVTKDIQLLTTAEHLLETYEASDKAALLEEYKQAMQDGFDGNFFKMRTRLRRIIDSVQKKG